MNKPDCAYCGRPDADEPLDGYLRICRTCSQALDALRDGVTDALCLLRSPTNEAGEIVCRYCGEWAEYTVPAPEGFADSLCYQCAEALNSLCDVSATDNDALEILHGVCRCASCHGPMPYKLLRDAYCAKCQKQAAEGNSWLI